MRKSRFSEAQFIGIIKEQEAGLPTSDLCRKQGLSPATFYKLKAKYDGMDLSDAKRLKQLEDENAKLRCLIPRLDGVILSQGWREALWDKFVTGAPRSSQRGAIGPSPLARARRQSSNTAIASFARAVEPGTRHQPQDGGEVAQARDG